MEHLSAAKEAADANYLAAEAAAWDNDLNGVALIEADLGTTAASIEDQHASVVSAALAAWNAYTAALAALPGSPEHEDRRDAPPAEVLVGCNAGPRHAPDFLLVQAPARPAQPQAQQPLLDWANAVQGDVAVIWGNVRGRNYSVPIRGGGTVLVWRPDDKVQGANRSFSHGLTFGGVNAPGGPFSPSSGASVTPILARGYRMVAQADARVGDIIVWRDQTGQPIHSAVLTHVVLNGRMLDVNQTRLDTKNGQLPQANQPLQMICNGDGQFFQGYGNNFIVYPAN